MNVTMEDYECIHVILGVEKQKVKPTEIKENQRDQFYFSDQGLDPTLTEVSGTIPTGLSRVWIQQSEIQKK